MLRSALDKGFSLYGINMPQPRQRHWTVEMLMRNLRTVNPTLLYQFLGQKLHAYITGDSEQMGGFKSNLVGN